MKTSKKKGKSIKPAQRNSHYEATAAAGCAIFLMAGTGTAYRAGSGRGHRSR